MNTNAWRELWLNAMNPVFYDGQPFVDIHLFSPQTYPAIQYLKDCNELQILILAWCILATQEEDDEDKKVKLADLQELFGNSFYSTNDFAAAIDALMCKNWIGARTFGGYLKIWANTQQLEKDRLYIAE